MKYVTIALALAVSVVTADFAFARGRHCGSCSSCAGGVCSVAPVQKGASAEAPAAPTAVVAAPAAVPQTNAVASYRRFGRRR